jgi:hypothetical protein
VGDPGGQRDEVVVGILGRIRIAQSLLIPALCHLRVGVRLRLREEVCKERKEKKKGTSIGIYCRKI